MSRRKRQRRLNLKVQPAGTASPFDRQGGGFVLPADFEKGLQRPLISLLDVASDFHKTPPDSDTARAGSVQPGIEECENVNRLNAKPAFLQSQRGFKKWWQDPELNRGHNSNRNICVFALYLTHLTCYNSLAW
jgi:hypothetical protein